MLHLKLTLALRTTARRVGLSLAIVALVFVIATIACHVGLRTTGGTAGVGKATTLSVVAGSVAVIASDFFVTQILIALMY